MIEKLRALMRKPRAALSAAAVEADEATVPVLDSLIRLRSEAAGLGLSPRNKNLSVQAGGYISPYRGRGMDFEEVRIYQPGDDIRTMDWRVTARTGEPHTKVYREEHERPVLFVVDQGPSMSFGTRVNFKCVVAAKAAALLAWAAMGNNDRVGGVVFCGHTHTELRPTARRRGVLQLCRALCTATPDAHSEDAGREPLNIALSRVERITRPGSVLFLLSDFRAADAETERHVMRLSRHCDVVVILIYDPLEADPPEPDRYPITDGRGFFTLDTTTLDIQNAYRERFTEQRDSMRRMCRRYGAHFLSLATHEPVAATLRSGMRVRH